MSDVLSVSANPPITANTSGTTVTLSIADQAIQPVFLSGDLPSPMRSGSGVLDAVSTHIGWFNVKDDFGAVGDGSTDDSLAIQGAIDAAYQATIEGMYRCGVIFFPPGRFVVRYPLSIGTGAGTDGGGIMLLGSGVQAMSAQQGSIIQALFSGDLFIIDVEAGGVVAGGGVTFRDLHIDRGPSTLFSGATFNWKAIVNGCIANVSTEGDYDVLQISQPGSNLVSQLHVFGCDFRNVSNRFLHCIGGCTDVHIYDNYLGGNQLPATPALLGSFDFTASDTCSMFTFRSNDIEGFYGGLSFVNSEGTLQDFWIEANSFDFGNEASAPCFQAIATGTAQVLQGHINGNWFALGNTNVASLNAIHLDAGGAGPGGPKVSGIHIEGNVHSGGTDSSGKARGAAIHLANGVSDITILAGRANADTNAIEIVGSRGTVDGVTISGFGANNPVNGYDTGSGLQNAVGILVTPSGDGGGQMTVQNLTITGCNLGGCSQFGLHIDSSGGGVIKQVAVVGNSFWGTTSPATAVKIAGSNNSAIHIADNPGYNPVGSGTAPPFVSGTPVRNPFPQAVRVYIVSATVTSLVITSPAGVATTTGIVATSSGAAFKLGVGESVTVLPGGVTAGSWKWFPL